MSILFVHRIVASPVFHFFTTLLSDFWYLLGTNRLWSVFRFVSFLCVVWEGRGISAIFSWTKKLTFRRTSNTPIFLMIIPLIVVFQYKYCSGFTYKLFTGNCFETQIYFCNLTLRSNTYRKMFIHIHDIPITWFVFFPRLKYMLGFNTNVNFFTLVYFSQ